MPTSTTSILSRLLWTISSPTSILFKPTAARETSPADPPSSEEGRGCHDRPSICKAYKSERYLSGLFPPLPDHPVYKRDCLRRLGPFPKRFHKHSTRVLRGIPVLRLNHCTGRVLKLRLKASWTVVGPGLTKFRTSPRGHGFERRQAAGAFV